MAPEDVEAPTPVAQFISPALAEVEIPDWIVVALPTESPIPLVPRVILPLLPAEASPVDNKTNPLDPLEDVPVLNVKWPLTPSVPAFADWIKMEPEDFAEPIPEVKETKPPVTVALIAAKALMFPE